MSTNPQPHRPAFHRGLAGIVWVAVLSACGGGGGSSMTPVASNADPVAAFSAPDSIAAGSAAIFDAAASSDADADPLIYSWEFTGASGGGKRGGGRQIAQAFATSGTYTVRLTVADGRGGLASASRTLAVTPGPASAGSVDTTIVVRDRSGALLADVMVASADSAASAATGADGRATLATPRGVASILRLSKAGYADQIKTLALPAGAENGYLEATMAPREPTLTLADATAGGMLTGKDGASVVFAAGSIVDAAGAPVSGPVQVAITPIDVAADVHSFPGRFEGLRQDGTSGIILSYGTVEFSISAAGRPVQLAPGRSATIEIPSYVGKHVDGSLVKAGDTTPLWSLDETTGGWVQEGMGTVVASATSPSGFALRAEVTHFSWWNSDAFGGPPAKPKPKCLVDSNADGVLEDLTGTGYCWHAGTGPEQPESIFSTSAAATGRKHALQSAGSQRIPAWAADAWTPAAGGVVLPIPGGLDITFRSYAKNGTLFGTKIVNLASGVEEDVPILLEPVAANPGTLAVALPYDERIVITANGETDRFTFTAEAGANYEVQVARNLSSLLAGEARVLGANGAQLAAGGFGTGAFATVVSSGAGGTMSVEVTAAAEAPGGYRVQIRKVVVSDCGTPQAVTLPQTLTVPQPIAAGATLCFNLPLQAGDAIHIAAQQFSPASGVITPLAPDGTAAVSRSYGGGVGLLALDTGVAQAGTWQVQIRNNATAPGTLVGLSFSRLALDGTIDLGGSASHAGPSTVTPRNYLVRPGAATSVAYKFVVRGGPVFGSVSPMGAQIDAGQTTGRVFAHPPLLLPLVAIEAGSAAAVDFTLSATAPETLPVDTDLGLTSPASGDVRIWRIDGSAGAQWTTGWASTSSFNMTLYGPNGVRLNPAFPRLYTLSASGIHTVELRTGLSSNAAAATIRVNTAAPPEPIVLTASTPRTVTLAIGELRRYAFNVTQAQLLALTLSTSTGTRGEAQFVCCNIYNGFVTLSPPNQLSKSSGPLYVPKTESTVVLLYSEGLQPSDASGTVTLDIQAPTPLPATLGTLLSAPVPPATLVDWRYDIATAGKHLLCYSYSGPTDNGGNTRVRGTVWGPVARFSNYSGDIVGSGQGTAIETLGDLSTGTNTLTLTSSLTATTPVTARLVPIPPATALAVGASDSGSIAPCERRYHTFAAVVGQAYTVRVTAGFAGSVRVRKVPPNGDVTARADPPFSESNLGGTPLALAAGVERSVTFTIPGDSLHGSGTYIIEVDGDGDAARDLQCFSNDALSVTRTKESAMAGLLEALQLKPKNPPPIQPQRVMDITDTQGAETTKDGVRPIAVKVEPPDLKARLDARDKALREAYAKLAKAKGKLEDEIPKRNGDTKATMQAQKADVDKALSNIDRQLKQVDADRKALGNPATDAKTMNDIAARAKSPEPIGKAVEVDKHDDPLEKSPLKKQTTTTTTEVKDGKSTTRVNDKSTSVGLDGVTRKTSDSTENVTAGGRTSDSTSRTTKVGMDGVSHETTKQSESEAAGKKTSSEEKKTVQVGPGGVSSTKETKTTAADGSGTSKKTSVGGERGDGKIGGNASTSTTATNADGGSTTKGAAGKGGVTAGDKGIGGYGEGTGSVEKKGANGLSVGAAAGLNANVVCNVALGREPGTYELQTTINLGASLSASTGAEKEGKGKVGATVSGSATVTMSVRHVLSEQEAAAYVAALKTGSGSQKEMAIIKTGLSKGWPEAQRMYRQMTGEFGTAADVDSMSAGDSKTIGRKLKGGAGVNAQGGPIGIEASAEKTDEREMTVTKNKDGSVDYDSKQGGSDAKSVGASVKVGIAEGGASVGKTVTTSTGFKLTIPPGTKNARKLQDQIAGLANAKVAEIEAFIKAHPEVKVERSDVRDDSSNVKVTAGVGGVKGTFGAGHGIEDTVTRDRDGKIIGTSKRGHNEGGLAVTAGGKQIGTEINEESAGRTDAEGKRVVDVKRAQSDTDVVDLLDSLPLVGSKKKKEKGALETAAGGSEETAKTRQVAGMTLTDGDLKALAALARNEQKWNNAAISPGDELNDWGKAARAIQKAGDDPKAVEDALATFVGSNNQRARVVFRAVRGVGNVTSGAKWEFPDSIAPRQKEYNDFVLAASETRVADAAKKGDKAGAKKLGQDLLAQLSSLYINIKSATDFKEKAAQQEMLTAIGTRQRAIELALRKVDGADDETAEKGQERADFERAFEMCIGYKQTETTYFQEIEAEHKKKLSNADPAEVMRITVEIKNLHALWTPQYDKVAMLAQENGWAKDRYWKYKPDTARLAEAVKTGKAGAESEAKPETANKKRDPNAFFADSTKNAARSAEVNQQLNKTDMDRYNAIKFELKRISGEVTSTANTLKALYAKSPKPEAEKLFNQANGPVSAADIKYKQLRPNYMEDMFDLGAAALTQYQQGLALLKKARALYPK